MKKDINSAIEEAKKRLEESLSEIEERQKKASENDLDEPEHLRSGAKLSELDIKRAMKEQCDEDPTE